MDSIKICIFIRFFCISLITSSQDNPIQIDKFKSLPFLECITQLKSQLKFYSIKQQDSVLTALIYFAQNKLIPNLEATCYYRKAYLHKNNYKEKEIDSLINRSLKTLYALEDEIGIAYNNIFLGKYYYKNKPILANQYSLKALSIFTTHKDTLGMAECYNNIGKIFSETENYSFWCLH